MVAADEGGDLPRADPWGFPSGVPALVAGAVGGCDMRLPAVRPVSSGAARRPRRAFTLLELLIVLAILGLLVALGLHSISRILCTSKAGAAQSTLKGLVAALSAYKTDFGSYPGEGASLTADTTVFVTALRQKDRQGVPYFRFEPEDIGPGGELRSPFDEPYYYTIPGAPNAGPDGASHPAPYYLWTAGCREGDPERRWEINNWSR